MVGVAQLAEHWVVAPGVEGSNPFTHPSSLRLFILPEVSREDSEAFGMSVSEYGPLAQLVEQLTLNQRVRSSNLRRPIL